MNKYIILTLTMLVRFNSSAQTVQYDFLKIGNRITSPPHVKRGTSIVFVVKDVNTFLYDVKVKGENVDSGIKNSEFLEVFNTSTKISDLINSGKSNAAASIVNALGPTGPSTFDEWKADYQNKLLKLDIAKNLYQSLYNLVYKDDRSTYTSIQTAVAKLDVGLDYFPSPGEVENIQQEGTKIILDLKKSFDSAETEYNKLSVANQVAKIHDFLEIAKQNEKVNSANYEEIFKKLSNLYSKATNPSTFNIQSDPITATKDLIRFKFSITPKAGLDPNVYVPTRTDSLDTPLTIPVIGGIDFDFSGGTFATIGAPLSKNYRINSLNVTDGKVQVRLEEVPNHNQLEQFGIGAMAHLSPRWSTSFKPALSLGFNLNSTDLKYTAILLGGSLLFKDLLGFDNRWLVVSCGFAFRKVDYLNPTYTLDKVYSKESIIEPLTTTTWRHGLFIGLTYNFTGKIKSQ